MPPAELPVPIHQVDAFVDRSAPGGGAFSGNPAAVCLPSAPLPDGTMQAIAAENNLSETAFAVPSGDGDPATQQEWDLRWFTPTVEVDLCGHATLATGHVLFEHVVGPDVGSLHFGTRSGTLGVARGDGDLLVMDLPADPRIAADPDPGLEGLLTHAGTGAALGATEWLGGDTWVAVLASEGDVRSVSVDQQGLAEQAVAYLVVTAEADPGSDVDFVSRFFAPGAGIPEDPVTGSAHCALMPLWAGKLGRNRLRARQCSRRGGFLDCELEGDTVRLRGRCNPYLSGTLRW